MLTEQQVKESLERVMVPGVRRSITGLNLVREVVISDQVDATLYQRYMSERGYMQGLEFRYLADEKSKGIFLFDILSDKIEEKNMDDPDELEISPFTRTNHTRYWLRGGADQNLPFGFSARLDTDYVSDQDYFREFQGSLLGYQGRPDLTRELGRSLEERYWLGRQTKLTSHHL